MKIRSEVFCIVYISSSSILTPFKGISTGIEIYIPTLFGYFPPTCPPAFCNPHNIHLQSFHFLHNFAMFSYFTKGSGIPWCHPHLNNCVPVFSFRFIGLVWISLKYEFVVGASVPPHAICRMIVWILSTV